MVKEDSVAGLVEVTNFGAEISGGVMAATGGAISENERRRSISKHNQDYDWAVTPSLPPMIQRSE